MLRKVLIALAVLVVLFLVVPGAALTVHAQGTTDAQDVITIPTDYAALITLLVNPLTMGMLLTWLLGHIPLIENDNVTNWIKFAVAIVLCLAWSLIVWIVKNGGLPQTAANWYGALYIGLAVAFVNQAFYQVLNNIPALRDFLLALFSRLTITGSALLLGTTGASIKTSVEVEKTTSSPPPASQAPAVPPGVNG